MKRVKIIRAILTIALFWGFSFLYAVSAHSQWKNLIQFDGKRINSLYFMDDEGQPDWGVLGLYDTITSEATLYYSRDGGSTWKPSKSPFHLRNFNFTFKDSLTGWIGATLKFFNQKGDNDSALWLKTTDGGKSWISLSPFYTPGNIPFAGDGHSTFFCYNRSNGLLLISSLFNPLCGSSDEGKTYFELPGGNSACTMISFTDNNIGVAHELQSPTYIAKITNDGGKNWNTAQPANQLGIDDYHKGKNSYTYRALPIRGTNFFFRAARSMAGAPYPTHYGVIYRSDDGGMNWNDVGILPQYLHPVNYLQGDLQRFYLETVDGVWISEDQGVTWRSICGPSRYDADTGTSNLTSYVTFPIGSPLYVKDNRAYIADGSGGLWFLDSKDIAPKLDYTPSSLSLNTPFCQPTDSVISIHLSDLCGDVQGQLLGASFSNSTHFQITSKSPPYTFFGMDSIGIRYSESEPVKDTAYLTLHYQAGNLHLDTVISLFGIGSKGAENIRFIPSLSNITASIGATTDIMVKPDKVESGKGLQMISFNLNYERDLLDVIPSTLGTGIPNASISYGTPILTGKTETLPIKITGADISLDPSQSIANIKFQIMVTDTKSSDITVSNFKFNNDDPNYQNCVLAVDSNGSESAYFTAIFQCGDTSLQSFIRTGSAIRITSIHPNPAHGELEIALQSGLKQDANVEIFNALGGRVYFDSKNLISGENKIHLITKNLSSGVYLVKVGGVSQSLVISR